MKTTTNRPSKNSKLALAGSAIPAVLVIATVAASLILQSSPGRKIMQAASGGTARLIQQNGDAGTRFTWDIRAAHAITHVSETELSLNGRDGMPVSYHFDPKAHTLTRTKGTESSVVLSDVDSLSFGLYQQPAAFDQLVPVGIENARVVGLKWTRLSEPKSQTPQTAVASFQVACR